MTRLPSGIERFGVVGFNHRQLPARLRGLLAFDEAWADQLATQSSGTRSSPTASPSSVHAIDRRSC